MKNYKDCLNILLALSKREKKRVELDTRPFVSFPNYDYTDEPANETSPGGGLYHGKMDKYKSVTDFRNKKKKEKKSLYDLAELFCKLAGDKND